MATGHKPRFAVVELQGYSEREIASADDLDSLVEQLELKTGRGGGE
jgi:hypothetical protein